MATRREQQDTSEAFQAITDILNLPLLTLKVDLVHGGKDDNDDHKLIQERLLNVAVPDENPEGVAIKLEDCLESYFNGRVDVNRFLERTHTNQSFSNSASPSTNKESSEHVEISELSWSTPNTPITPHTPSTPLTPGPRLRAPSIIRHRLIAEGEEETTESESTVSSRPTRKGSIRKEVLMPAWQFYHLIRPSQPIYLHHIQPCFCSSPPSTVMLIDKIAWHTEKNAAAPDGNKIADHFQSTRPVLGVCLKRYTFSPDGRPLKKKTYIDIPLDLRLPHFVNEDQEDNDRSLDGQFKLSLQSVICHRGDAINSGHYVAFIRGSTPAADGDSQSTRTLSNEAPPGYAEDQWIMFDDNGSPRVQYSDISKALKKETPYLLFYQVQPIQDMSVTVPEEAKPPSYIDSGVAMSITECSPGVNVETQSQNQPGYFDGANDDSIATIRPPSDEYERHASPRISLTIPDERRGSLAQTEVSVHSLASTASSILATSAPVTPIEETVAQRFSRAAASMTKLGGKSRPSSQSGENRISATFSKLSLMGTRSKEQLPKAESGKEPANEIALAAKEVSEPRKSITIDESARPSTEASHTANGNGTITRSRSKKEKKKHKSKSASENTDCEPYGPKEKGKAKGVEEKGKAKVGEKDQTKLPDRECMIM